MVLNVVVIAGVGVVSAVVDRCCLCVCVLLSLATCLLLLFSCL